MMAHSKNHQQCDSHSPLSKQQQNFVVKTPISCEAVSMRTIRDRTPTYLTGTVGLVTNKTTVPMPTNVTVKSVALDAYLRSTLKHQISANPSAGSMGPDTHQAQTNVKTSETIRDRSAPSSLKKQKLSLQSAKHQLISRRCIGLLCRCSPKSSNCQVTAELLRKTTHPPTIPSTPQPSLHLKSFSPDPST